MLQFNKLIIHNFGSYAHSEIDLSSKGFCLVSGTNNYKQDNAISNGAGKSLLWNAVCFALTGETINGLRTNLKNVNIDENLCYVSLEFYANNDKFLITRITDPKSDLKIIKNDVDVSGKGIRESEKKLDDLLPDLNKDLIASTIIIGQGMPNKFSSFSPCGRKELLEKLTKSDFMIEDIKSRVTNRTLELNTKLREYEDSLLTFNTQLKIAQSNLLKVTDEYKKAVKPDFDNLIADNNKKLSTITTDICAAKTLIKDIEDNIKKFNEEMLTKTNAKNADSTGELQAYNTANNKLNEEKLNINFKITSLQKEITNLKAIKDVCPTCGQKMPNVKKPSTELQEAEVVELRKSLNEVIDKMTKCTDQHNAKAASISNTHDAGITKVRQNIFQAQTNLANLKTKVSQLEKEEAALKTAINKDTYDRANWEKYYTGLAKTIAERQATEAELLNKISLIETAKLELKEHAAVIQKMNTLIKRDFRGYLLTNIIKYIDTKAKDYSDIVFGTRDLNVYLDGNSLDISYNKKMFDNLSGGEKQRVDLILQFALRNMLNAYLNTSSNILVLDEITDFLDKQSCGAVMKLLETELNTTESVFIVSHHAEALQLPIDSEIKIIKNYKGISEVY